MISLDPTLLTGPLLLGHLFNSFLYGVELLQFYRYMTSFPDDRPWNRQLVYSLIFLDTLQSGFAIHNAWKILGSGWGDAKEIYDPEWSWGTVPLFTGIVSLLVQGFYASRISKLIQSKFTKWIVGVILLISITQSICGVLAGIYYSLGSITGIKHTIKPLTTMWLGGTALCDLIISTTIVTFLLTKISGFTPSNNVVSRVIKMTLEIGAITTSAAGVDLALFLVYPNNNLHLIFCIPLAKIYSNTLLAMLNARKGSLQQDGLNPCILPTIRQSTKSRSLSEVESFISSIGQHQGSVIHITRQPSISIPSPSVYSSFTTSPNTASPNTSIHLRRIAKPQPVVRPTHRVSYHGANPSVTSGSDQFLLSSSFMSPKQKSPPAKRTEFQSSILRMQRPTKAQANADFDKDFPPSHLDLSTDARTSFRNWRL